MAIHVFRQVDISFSMKKFLIIFAFLFLAVPMSSVFADNIGINTFVSPDNVNSPLLCDQSIADKLTAEMPSQNGTITYSMYAPDGVTILNGAFNCINGDTGLTIAGIVTDANIPGLSVSDLFGKTLNIVAWDNGSTGPYPWDYSYNDFIHQSTFLGASYIRLIGGLNADSVKNLVVNHALGFGLSLLAILGLFLTIGIGYLIFRYGASKLGVASGGFDFGKADGLKSWFEAENNMLRNHRGNGQPFV